MIHADAVWNQGFYGQGVTVAVVDTAVDITHPQLIPRFAINDKEANGKSGQDDDGNGYVDDILGWDFIRNAPPAVITDNQVYHGTHVAGIIAADPTKGSMSGVAPQAKILQASFIDENNGSMSDAIKAIQYAAFRGARIINASWGGPDCSATLQETIAEVGNQGVLFVVASGNDGYDYDRLGPTSYQYPAVFNLPNMLSVAATDALDQLTSFSNRSYSLVHIGAPGSDIRSTVPTITDSSGYRVLQGTSMATPFVSGAAALLWSAKPTATVAQIRQALVNSTDFRSYKVSTQGRLNVEKALTEIRRIVP
jgi:subtilisin family serine protease